MTTFTKKSITAESASAIIRAGERAAAAAGQQLVFAIVDESGALKALSRMDGAPLLAVQIAHDKAYTAAGFGMPTEQWHDIIQGDSQLAAGAVGGIDRLVVFAGGLPIVVDGALVGGLGVSGGHHSDDLAAAESALESFAAEVAAT